MRFATSIVSLGLTGLLVGCHDNTPPPPRVPVPAPQARHDDAMANREREDVKPLPPQPRPGNDYPFDDPPLMSQETPEGPAFVDAYHRVGSPRITVFVNRSLDGSFDRGDGNTMDYQAIETIMTDWLSCNGNVMIISPKAARQRLNDQQVRDLQDNQPAAVGAVGQQVGAEILVHVQAHPTRQVEGGQEMRIIAEALNTRGGQSIGRAVVDVPPPLDKPTINRYTRFLARKLMDDMMNTWSAPPPPGARDRAPPAARQGEIPDTAPREMRPREPGTQASPPAPTSPPATQP